MATASNRAPREKIEFPPNVPVTMALKFAQAKVISGTYGESAMVTTVDNRVAFLPVEVAGQIEAAGVNVREPFTLTQKWDGGKDSPRSWEVAKLGEQRDGTCVVPKLPPEAVTPKPPATAATPTRREDGAAHLVAESIAMVDAYAAVLEHALTKHSGKVKPDEVRAIFLTTAINVCGGKRNAA